MRSQRHQPMLMTASVAENLIVNPQEILQPVLDAMTGASDRGHASNVLLSDQLLDKFARYLFEPGVRIVLMAAGCILCLGVLLTVLNTTLFFVNKLFKTRIQTVMDFWPNPGPVQLTRVKLQLGYTVSVALQLLLAADVLDTLVKPSHSFSIVELLKLGMIASIRTTLAYFLNKEVEECESELENSEQDNVTI